MADGGLEELRDHWLVARETLAGLEGAGRLHEEGQWGLPQVGGNQAHAAAAEHAAAAAAVHAVASVAVAEPGFEFEFCG